MNIVIIGAGNLGRRHLQSLMNVRQEIKVYVYDPSEASITLAKDAVNNAANVDFITDFGSLPKEVFLTIIATSSIHRKSAIRMLLQQAKVENLVLEKFLFTRLSDFSEVQELLIRHGVKCWVNCPRRMYPFYRELKKQIKGPVTLHVSGSNWGLACNSIHFLDLHYFLSPNMGLSYELDTSKVTDKIYASKREGYTEFMGTLSLQGNDGSTVSLSCSEDGNMPVTVNIESLTHKLYIQEGAPGRMMAGSKDNNWVWQWEEFRAPFQSQLTAEFVEQIIATGNCELPVYAESAGLHQLLLEGWIAKSRLINTTATIDECIIT